MTSLAYHGRVFDERTNWLSFIRDALSGRDYSGLRQDVPDVKSSLSQLAADLRGTDLYVAYCDALLRLVESGSKEERDQIAGLPYIDAPRGTDRMIDLLVNELEKYRADSWISSILEDVLKRRPDDARSLAIVRDEVQKPKRTSGVLELAAEYQSTWFSEILPKLGLIPDGHQIVMWLKVTQDRRGLMDALIASGPSFLEALDRRLHEPRMPPSISEQFRDDFAKHPAFAPLLR